MKKFFLLSLAVFFLTAAQAADYQLSLSYARAYVMNADTHQFQFEFINMENYESQGSILFCAADNNHINGTYTIDGDGCTALLVVEGEQTFEAVSGSFEIMYSHQANFMSYYSISGLLTDGDGKTLELTGAFGSYAAYDYNSYYQYMMGEIGYEDLISYDLLDYEDAVVDYAVNDVASVTGYSMYNYYASQGYPRAGWRLNLLDDNGKVIAQMVLFTEDEYHIAGTYNCSENSFTYFDGANGVEANTGIYSITFDHKTDSIAYYQLKGELQHNQGSIVLDCMLPIGLLPDYQSMAENFENPEVEIIYVELKDYQNGEEVTAIERVSRLTDVSPSHRMYNLAGQRVDNSWKGVVVVDGKKVMISE